MPKQKRNNLKWVKKEYDSMTIHVVYTKDQNSALFRIEEQDGLYWLEGDSGSLIHGFKQISIAKKVARLIYEG